MSNLNTTNQSKDKIHTIPGYSIGSFTCYNENEDEMWYGHEENINHPEGSEYPVSVNVPHMKVMRDRVFDSVLNRTGIDVRKFDSILHATTKPGIDENGNIINYANENIIRNV